MSKTGEILSAVKSVILGLELDGISDGNVVVAKRAVGRKGLLPALPGVVITPEEGPQVEAATAAADDLIYLVQVATVQAANQDATANLERALQWREDIINAFKHRRLSDVASVYHCDVSPLPAFDKNAWLAQYDTGGVLLGFRSREIR